MNVYDVLPVLDNPLFEGLVLTEDTELLDTWPADWRVNYRTWQPRSMKATWPTPEVVGQVRKFNDYPCINWKPAFSQRAVDMLHDMLEPNGELLPVRHKLGTYYFYNCTRMTNCIDLTKSKVTRLKDGGIVTSTEKLVFLDDQLDDLTIFKVRTQLLEVFCTQRFVDRLEMAGLQGFRLIPIWPLPQGVTYFNEMYRVSQLSKKWKPKDMSDLDIKANTVVLRLYCEKKKPSKQELATVETIMSELGKVLYDANQRSPESYFGNVEGHDVVDYEIRVFLSAPDCNRLVEHLAPMFKKLPWPGQFHVVKRRGIYIDEVAMEEYVQIL